MVFLFFLGASGLDPGAKVEGRIGSLSGRFKNTGIDWKGGQKNEDENCTSSFSSSTIPLTSGIEEAPQLLLSVDLFVPHSQS